MVFGTLDHGDVEDTLSSIEEDLAQLQQQLPAPVAAAQPAAQIMHTQLPQVVVQRVAVPILVTHRIPYRVLQRVPVPQVMMSCLVMAIYLISAFIIN